MKVKLASAERIAELGKNGVYAVFGMDADGNALNFSEWCFILDERATREHKAIGCCLLDYMVAVKKYCDQKTYAVTSNYSLFLWMKEQLVAHGLQYEEAIE
jgi:hypothetical protein